jgi:hypothetical protein
MEQGILSGKYRPGEPPPDGSRARHESEGARFIRRVSRDDVLAGVQQLVPLAQAENLTPAQLAIAWVLPEAGATRCPLRESRQWLRRGNDNSGNPSSPERGLSNRDKSALISCGR